MRVTLAALAIAGALTAQAEAACSTSRLAGKWRILSDAATCVVTISSAGKVSSGGCRDYRNDPDVAISGGKLWVSSGCRLTGSIVQGVKLSVQGWMDDSMNFGVGSFSNATVGVHPAQALRLP